MKDFTQVFSFPSPQSAAEVDLWLKLRLHYDLSVVTKTSTFTKEVTKVTANQIAYYKAEREAQFNAERNRLQAQANAEAARANRAAESHNRRKLAEDVRSNTAREALSKYSTDASTSLGWSNLSESSRHNLAAERNSFLTDMAANAVRRQQTDETRRTNLVREAETERANRANEDLASKRFHADNIFRAIDSGNRTIQTLVQGFKTLRPGASAGSVWSNVLR